MPITRRLKFDYCGENSLWGSMPIDGASQSLLNRGMWCLSSSNSVATVSKRHYCPLKTNPNPCLIQPTIGQFFPRQEIQIDIPLRRGDQNARRNNLNKSSSSIVKRPSVYAMFCSPFGDSLPAYFRHSTLLKNHIPPTSESMHWVPTPGLEFALLEGRFDPENSHHLVLSTRSAPRVPYGR